MKEFETGQYKPKYMIDRTALNISFEDEEETKNSRLPFYVANIVRGQTRGMSGDGKVANTSAMTGKIQLLVEINRSLKKEITEEAKEGRVVKKINPNFEPFLKVKNMMARIYILEGQDLSPHDEKTSDPYLVLKLGDKVIKDLKSKQEKTNNPKFYRHYDFSFDLPGQSSLQVEVWDDDGFLPPDLIGVTKFDLEGRYYLPYWSEKYPKNKPVENRPLYLPTSNIPQGLITCWLEIFEAKDASIWPIVDITPPPTEEFEVRVIVWKARTSIFKDTVERCNDLYVTCKLGKEKEQTTDTHWRARKEASFNWRMKFPITFEPLRSQDDQDTDYSLEVTLWP